MPPTVDEPELIQCSGCHKRFFTDGFRVTRLGRRCKTCLECSARQKAKDGRRQCKHGISRRGCDDCDNFTPALRQCSHGVRRDCVTCDRVARFAKVIIKRFAKAVTSEEKGDRSTRDILGCDIPTFLVHLESKFTPEMTWDNYGEVWNLAYVVSLAHNPESRAAGRYVHPTVAVKMSRLHYENAIPQLSLTDLPRPPVVSTAQPPGTLTDDDLIELLGDLW